MSLSSDPYARDSVNVGPTTTQSVSMSSMAFGETDESYNNDHKNAGCCACSASVSNFLYALILCLGAVFAFIAKFASNHIISGYGAFCPKDSDPQPFIVTSNLLQPFEALDLPIPSIHDLCVQNQTIYRISFVLATFFLLMAIVTFIARKFHYESWIFKVSLISGLFTISAFIPGQFFAVYREVARWGSFLFMVMQVLTVVNFAHTMHENIVKHIQNDGEDSPTTKKARILYLGLSLSALIGSAVGIILLFVKYAPCGLHIGMIIVTMLLGLLIIALSLTSAISKGLLPPSLLTLMCVATTYQALSTNTTEACIVHRTDMPLWVMIASFLIALGQVIWLAISTANQNRELIDTTAKHYSNPSPLSARSRNVNDTSNPYANLDGEDDTSSTAYKAMGRTSNELREEDEVETNPPKHWVFHITLVSCAMYLAMMLSGWGGEIATSINNTEASIQSFWVKIIAVWASYALYIWTMVAPLIFPDRDFSSQ